MSLASEHSDQQPKEPRTPHKEGFANFRFDDRGWGIGTDRKLDEFGGDWKSDENQRMSLPDLFRDSVQ